jgi:class 3 adenylate cyclase/tetratricopeptide (TPR) repeat protein
MKCPKCQFENPDEMQFCVECGNKLDIKCPQCGFGNSPTFKFCGKCGQNLSRPTEPSPKSLSFDEKLDKIQRYLPKGLTEKILSQRDRIEGERKQVTVMFCDMEGFTQLIDGLGLEEAYTIMDQVYEILIHKVHDYEGTVNEMTGDGIMALFGAPIALEDASQRAIRSGMAIHREMAKYSESIKKEREAIPPLKMRIGIHTGPVVVGTLGNNLRVDFKAVGDTVNLASRMEGLALPGTTFVTEEIFRLAEGLFIFEPIGEKQVKGKEAPVKVYQVIASSTRRSRFDVSAERGLTPFSGRQRELELLLDGFEWVKGGRGQAFSIVAEAGVGKSRLLYEFRKIVSSQNVLFLEGRCLSYSRGVAYHVVIDFLKANFDIREGDGDSEIRRKVKYGLKILGVDEALTLPYFLELFSVRDSDSGTSQLSPEAKKDKILQANKLITLAGSEIRPLILVYEDLHWIDKSSEDALKYLLECIPAARVMLIFTYRPEFVHTWGGKSYHSQVPLNRLSNRESLTVAKHLLNTEVIDRALEDFILEKTEGVPLFIEEFIKSLKALKIIEKKNCTYYLSRDTQDIMIPSTIHDVIMARVDVLPVGAKEVLQTGSAIEREFSYQLISRIQDFPEPELLSHLSILKDSELVYERGIYPQSTYIFKHALTQVVAYDSLLAKRKQELHRRIGQAIEDLYTDRLAEQYEALAYHFARGEAWEKALEYLCRAAEKAAQTFSNHEAVDFYDQALEAAEHLADAVTVQTLITIHQAKMNLHFILSEFEKSRAEGELLLTLARRVGDRAKEGVALAAMGRASHYAHDSKQGLIDCTKAIKIATETNAELVLASSHYIIGAIHAVHGRFQQARESINQVLAFSPSEDIIAYQSFALYLSGLMHNWEGGYAKAVRSLSESVKIGRKHNLPGPLLQGLWGKGLALTAGGNYDEARVTLEEGLALSEKVGDEIWGHRILNSLGWLYGECGGMKRALDLNRRAAAGSRKREDHETIANAELNLGDIFLAQKDLNLAQEFLQGVYRLVNDAATTERMRWRYSTHLFASLGEFWLIRGDPVKAGEFVEQCLENAGRTNSKKYLAQGWRLRGEIAHLQKQPDEAENALRQALTIAEAIGNPTQLWKTYLTLGRLHTEARRKKKAEHSYNAARGVIDKIMESLQDPELRTSLKNHPLICQIFDLSAPE